MKLRFTLLSLLKKTYPRRIAMAVALIFGLLLWIQIWSPSRSFARRGPAESAPATYPVEAAPTIGKPHAQSDGQIIGTPWTGEAGIRETVEQIMARDRVTLARIRERDPEPKRQRPDRRDLPQNPEALSGLQWPPLAEAETPLTETDRKAMTAAAQTVGLNFTGVTLGETSSFPPDTMGAAGPTQFLVTVNGRIKVFDKLTGAVGALNADMDAFFASVRAGSFTSDPRVRFDRLTGRWIVAIINVSSTDNRILLAVSNNATINASTVWTFFSFVNSAVTPTGDTGCFADYPTLAVDANALYVGVNNFCPNSYAGTTAFVIRKTSVLGTGPIVVTAFRNLSGPVGVQGLFTPMGVDNYDPAATDGYLIGVDNRLFGNLIIRKVSTPGGTPVLSPNIFIPVLATIFPRTVPHLGNNNGATGYLDAIDDRLFAAHLRQGRIWTAHNIAVNNTGTTDTPRTRNAVRWYEIKDLDTAAPSLAQAGTLFAETANNSPDDRNYWIPSVMVSGQGHAAFGFSVAGTNEYINAGTAGRFATDPLGLLRESVMITSSTTAYNPPSNTGSSRGYRRWGDYSYTSLDPVDNMTMWTVQQFCDSANSYGVRVVKLLAPPPAVPVGVNPPSVAAGINSADLTITGLATNGAGFYDPGTGFTGRLRAAIKADSGPDVTVNSITYLNPTTIRLNISTVGVTPGIKNITITNPDDQSVTGAGIFTVGQCSYTVTPTTRAISAQGGTGTIDVTAGADCGWTAASNAAWITVNSGTPGKGNGTVNYTVAPNIVNAARTGTLTVAGQTVTITQAEGAGCTFALEPAERTVPAQGGTGSFAVKTVAECAWTATTTSPFIRLITTGSGAGNGTVNYSVLPSDSPIARTGRILVGNTSFTITQDAAPLELAVDDGTFETAYRFGSTNSWAVNRLTPESYPATLKEVAIHFRSDSGLRVGDPVTVLVGANADGDDNINNTNFQTVSATVQRLDDFNVYAVPNVTINSGDFVVGLQMPFNTTFPFSFDRSSTPRRRSYSSTDGINFQLFDNLVTPPGNFSFRARLQRPARLVLASGTKLEAENCQQGNQAIDPGEAVTVSFSLRNMGTESIGNLVATLQPTGGITSPGAPQTYGPMVPGDTPTSKSFTFIADPAAACGGTLTATLKLQDGTTDRGTVSFTLPLGALTTFSATDEFTTTSTGVALPDANSVEVPITVSATGIISDVNVRVRINHTDLSDLDLFLIAPDGTQVELATDISNSSYGTGNNDCTGVFTAFDDQAQTSITAGTTGLAGAFRPEGSLAVLNGKPSNGVWKLRIVDDASGDSGTLGCWRLEISRRLPLCCREGCPTASRISPEAGPAGRSVTITGTNFTGVTGVRFARNLPATFTVTSDTQITATAPVGVVTGPITLIKAGCGEVPAGLFTAPLCPTVSSLDPPANVIGASIRINGNNFTGVTSVKFANGVSAQFTVTSNTVITATVPAGATTGPITIGKTDCADAVTSTFTVLPCPTITGLSPNAGQVGSTVIINGAGLTGVTTVRFNNSVSASFTVNSDTQITATVPSGAITGAITLLRTNCANATSGTFTVQPPPPVPISMTPSAHVIPIGGTSLLTVFIPAQTGSTALTMTSSNSAIASTAPNQTIPSGASSITVPITGNGIGGPVTITATMPASLGGLSASTVVHVTARTLRAAAVTGTPGGSVIMPIELVAQGDENAFGFSLNFDQTMLSNPQVALGADASGAALSVNSSLATQGRIGVALALPAGEKFAAGTRQVARITFQVAANMAALTTPISFGDQPVAREAIDANANPLPVVYAAGSVNQATGYEGDVSPRPNGNGNGQITIADWVQIGRFVAGLDKVDEGSELQRADCAPRDGRGDGQLTVADWTQASRYASGVDPISPAGGPTATATLAAQGAGGSRVVTGGRVFRTIADGGKWKLSLDAQGNEHALAFSLLFNPSEWRFKAATAEDSLGATLLVNSAEASQGRVGLAMSLAPGQSLRAGARQLLTVEFERVSGTDALRLGLGDFPVAREIVDRDAAPLSSGRLMELAGITERTIVHVSSASFLDGGFAAEQLVTAFGSDLATETASAKGQPLPLALAGTTVHIRDAKGTESNAPLLYASPLQVNYQLPAGLAIGTATVTIKALDGTASISLIEIVPVAPSLFTANGDGHGAPAAVLLRIGADGSSRYEAVTVFDQSRQRYVPAPIDLGSGSEQVFLILYGCGLGKAETGLRARFLQYTSAIPGIISYAGRQGSLAGIDQINLRLPSELAGRGEFELELNAGGRSSNRVLIVVR